MLKIDADGEIVNYVEEIKLENQNHTYEVCIPFFVDDHNVILLAYPSSNDEVGVDLIQILDGGQILLKGHLTTGGSHKLGIGGIDMNENGDIVFLFQWEGKYAGAMGFHISDFGINLSSEDEHFVDPTPLLTVSPNPASDEITIYITDEKYGQGMVQIYNMTGQNMLQQIISHGETLNVRDLAVGSYIVQFSPDSRPGYFLTTKLVKGR